MKTSLFFFLIIFSFGFKLNLLAQQLPNKTTLATFDFALNPAMTASANFLDVGAYYRQQWLGFESAPSTGVVSFQYPFVNQNMSVGVYFMHDEINLLDANEFAFTYSYKLKIGMFYQDQLSIGFLANVKQIGFDGTNIISSSNKDLLLIQENTSSIDGNFGAGIFYTTNQNMYDNDDNTFFIGFGASQLIPAKNDLFDDVIIRKQIHTNALLGGRFVNNFIFFEPSIWINYTPNAPILGKGSLLMEKEKTFWAGLSYQTDNTIDIQIGIIRKLGDGFLRIGALSGYNIGTTGEERGVGYEVLIGYQLELD